MNRFAIAFLVMGCAAGAAVLGVSAQVEPAKPDTISATDAAQALHDFNGTCASCHGDGGGGGDRAPALGDNAHLRTLDAAGIEAIIKGGQRGMPPFPNLPQAEVSRLAAWIHSMNISGLQAAPREQVAAGEAYFYGAGGCGGCHMVRGRGASSGPDLSSIAARSTRAEMEKWLDDPTSADGHQVAAQLSGLGLLRRFPMGGAGRHPQKRREAARLCPPPDRASDRVADPGRQIPHALRAADRQRSPGKAFLYAGVSRQRRCAARSAGLSGHLGRDRSRSVDRRGAAGAPGRHRGRDASQTRRLGHL